MTRHIVVLVALASCAVVGGGAACVPDATPEGPVRPFTVKDGFIRDGDGRALIMRGVNLSGHHKEPPFFDFHQPPDYAQIHDEWGMNAIRFLVSWAALEPSPDAYDDDYVAGIVERMQWAKDAGLHVVIDMHQDLYGLGFAGGNGAPVWTCAKEHYDAFLAHYDPSQDWFFHYLDPDVVACYDQFWRSDDLWNHYGNAVAHLASAVADNDAVLGVDLMNEPYWGSAQMERFESQELQPFYEHIIPMVRDAAPSWLIFAEPGSSRNLGVATGLVTLPFDDVVYAPHSYDASAERGLGFDDTHRAGILDNAVKLRAEASSLSAALWIGEYGGMTDKAGIADYMDTEYDAAAAVAGSTMYWDDSRQTSGYAILNDDGSEKTELTDVLVRPYPERVAGTPTSYDFDPATKTFTLTLADRTDGGTTDIVIPSRVYPGGVDVDCGGCDVAVDGQLVHLKNVGADVVVVRAR